MLARRHSKRGKKRGGKVHKVLHEFKHGQLHSGSKRGKIVPKGKRKQAVAIALSEARKAGENV